MTGANARDAIASLQSSLHTQVHYLTHVGARSAKALLEHYAFPEVESIFTSPEAQCRMCRPSLLETFSGKLRELSDSDILFASDDPAELAMAKRMELTTIALEYGRTPASILTRAQPDLTIQSPQNLPAAIMMMRARPGAAGAH